MKRLPILAALGLAFVLCETAQAFPVKLGVYKFIDKPDAKCPDQVIITEENAPYFEGGYTINGQANLSSFAEPFTIAASDFFSVTWVANLKKPYRQCVATAGIEKYGDSETPYLSHLRLRLIGGKVYLILDLTGIRDANGFTASILKKRVNAGNPTWSWGGSD